MKLQFILLLGVGYDDAARYQCDVPAFMRVRPEVEFSSQYTCFRSSAFYDERTGGVFGYMEKCFPFQFHSPFFAGKPVGIVQLAFRVQPDFRSVFQYDFEVLTSRRA